MYSNSAWLPSTGIIFHSFRVWTKVPMLDLQAENRGQWGQHSHPWKLISNSNCHQQNITASVLFSWLSFTWSNITFQWNSPVFSRVTHMQTENPQCFQRIQHHLPPPKRTLVWIFQPMNLMIPELVELLFNFPLVKATRSSPFSLVGTNSSYLIDWFLGFRTPPKQ